MNEGEESGRFVIKDRRSGWYDPKITLGNILTILGMFVTIMLAWGQLDKQQEILRTRFDLYIASNEREKAIRESLDKILNKLDEQNRQLDEVRKLCR